jgi:hypothetical protein
VLFLLVTFIIVTAPALARAQNCSQPITPSNDTSGNVDWNNIDYCLRNANQAVLGPGTFYISQKIRFTAPNVSLIGSGRNSTTVKPKFSCTNGPVIDVNGQGGVDVSNGVIRDFKLDLSNMSGSCVEAPQSVRFLRATGGQISGMTIAGSGSPTSGGASIGAIVVNRSSNIVVSGNEIRDIGGSSSSGIAIENSPSSIVDGNTILRVAAGIVVRNNGGVSATFDSSNTRVTNNTIRFTTGRTMKLAAPDADSVPLLNVIVAGNWLPIFH